MTRPTITVELTLHQSARDGQQNAWKMEMSGPDGAPLLKETGRTAASCLDRASDYMASCGAVEHTFVVPPVVAAMADR
jgi:hypothetical protein